MPPMLLVWHAALTKANVFPYLVLAPPPDVPAEVELFLVELVPGEHVVEFIHWQIDDVVDGEVDSQFPCLALIS